MRYTIEGDLDQLHQAGKTVLMYTVVGETSWVILWCDDQGHTVSSVVGNSRHNGSALPARDAQTEFEVAVRHILRDPNEK